MGSIRAARRLAIMRTAEGMEPGDTYQAYLTGEAMADRALGRRVAPEEPITLEIIMEPAMVEAKVRCAGGGSGYGAGGGGYSAGYKYAYYGGNSGYVKTSVVVLTSANTIPISVGGGGSGSVRGKNGIAGTTSGGGARVNGENTGIGGAGGYNNIPGEGGASGGGAGGYVVISW